MFLANNIAFNAREQLLYALWMLDIVPPADLRSAVQQSERRHKVLAETAGCLLRE